MKSVKVIMTCVAIVATLSAIVLSWCSFETKDGVFFSKVYQGLFILVAVTATKEAASMTEEED